MASGSVEATLELWASSLREVKGRIRPVFLQERMAQSAGLFLDALLGPERRKTGWMRAEAAGDPGPWRQQALLSRAQWDADALRDVVRDYVVETLADRDAVLVVDETGFLKQGKASCGVGRQSTGLAGKITNCQIGCLPLTSPARAMPSSTVLSICRKPGQTTQHAALRHTCRRMSPSRPSRSSHGR
jgi:SRSO17 transposase